MKSIAALAFTALSLSSVAFAEITTAKYPGWDSLGHDTDSQLSGTEANCAQNCLDRVGCTASVFTKWNGRCWLKNAAPKFTRLDNAVLILKVVAGKSGIDYPGGDYRWFASDSAQNCGRQCYLESKCVAFTYVTSTKTCWLKSAVVDAGFLDGAISGKK